jgi:4-hydroxyacetophenone monooxygenase
MTVFRGISDLRAAVGRHLGASDWMSVDERRARQFADATGDHHWIHATTRRSDGVDLPGLVPGFLTLSLIGGFAQSIFVIQDTVPVNYGLAKVRFPTPFRVGGRARATACLMSCDEVPGGIQTEVEYVMAAENADKPVCVARHLCRHFYR